MFICRAPIGQAYGLTETCAGGAFSESDDVSVGRVGPPLPCSYIKVCHISRQGKIDLASQLEPDLLSNEAYTKCIEVATFQLIIAYPLMSSSYDQ